MTLMGTTLLRSSNTTARLTMEPNTNMYLQGGDCMLESGRVEIASGSLVQLGCTQVHVTPQNRSQSAVPPLLMRGVCWSFFLAPFVLLIACTRSFAAAQL